MMSQREVALTFIEELRRRKDVLKEHISKLSLEIVEIDIQIRDIRQHLPPEQPVIKVKKRLTQDEKDQKRLKELEIELAQLKEKYKID